jgi:hypothetical protein
MKVLAWIFVGLVGAGATYVTLTTDSDQLAIIGGLIGFFSWGMFAWSALSITVYDGGTAHTTRYPAMAAYGLMLAAPNLYVALTGPLELVKDRETIKQEVQE